MVLWLVGIPYSPLYLRRGLRVDGTLNSLRSRRHDETFYYLQLFCFRSHYLQLLCFREVFISSTPLGGAELRRKPGNERPRPTPRHESIFTVSVKAQIRHHSAYCQLFTFDSSDIVT